MEQVPFLICFSFPGKHSESNLFSRHRLFCTWVKFCSFFQSPQKIGKIKIHFKKYDNTSTQKES